MKAAQIARKEILSLESLAPIRLNTHQHHYVKHHHVSTKHGQRCKIITLRAGFSPLIQDVAVSTMVLGETLIWLKIWTTLATRGVVESTLTRKIIHLSCVPFFILHWPLYSASPSAAYLAASIPLAQMLR
ncbi:hypothetical protein EON65_34820 [archaeon]|nr:MAG: hypothetical protein EON65_34820 [archaeon]